MTLRGLATAPPGAVAVAALCSTLVSTCGLTLLRVTRPREANRYGEGLLQRILVGCIGAVGAIVYYFGLVLGSLDMLMGAPTEDEGKAAGVLQCSVVLLCWMVERWLLLGRPLPPLQSAVCAAVWFGSTLINWFGPQPFDNVSLGMAGQSAGCAGGYRSPFLVYAALWVTSLLFGTLLVLLEQGAAMLSCARRRTEEEPEGGLERTSTKERVRVRHGFRRKVLPIIFGFAASMSGVAMAIGASRSDEFWMYLGAGLLCLATTCAWDWMWRMELTLSSWAALSHGYGTMLRVGQAHLLFRDFRWNPDTEHGLLVVWRWPGLPMFLIGMFIIVSTMLMYVYTSDWGAWVEPEEEEPLLGESGTRPRSTSTSSSFLKRRNKKYVWQWFLLPVCMICLVVGISVPLIQTEITMPKVSWLRDDMAYEKYQNSTGLDEDGIRGHHFTRGKSYLDLITWLYDRRLPCSALVVAYNSLIMPPLQFLCLLTVLLRPSFLPEDIMHHLRAYLMNQAPSRFTNPMILMTMVGFMNLSGPAGVQYEANFTRGFWYFLTYCVTSVILAWSVQASEEEQDSFRPHAPAECFVCEPLACLGDSPASLESSSGSSNEADMEAGAAGYQIAHGICPAKKAESRRMDRFRGEKRKNRRTRDVGSLPRLFPTSNNSDGEGSSDGEATRAKPGFCMEATELFAVVGLTGAVATAIYLALTQPYLTFEYRLSGVILEKREPSILDLWRSLAAVNRPLSVFAALTSVFTLLFWLGCLATRILSEADSRRAKLPATVWARHLEQGARPWVMGHIWALSFVLVYYIVTARNRAVVEVCAHFPERPTGMIAIVAMGAGVIGLVNAAKMVTKQQYHHHHSHIRLQTLPGGVYFWGIGPVLVGALCIILLYRTGPEVEPEISGVDGVNHAFAKILPTVNEKLREKLPQSFGDCDALWQHQLEVGKVIYDRNRTGEPHKNCVGTAPLAQINTHKGNSDMVVSALWASGLDTLEINRLLVHPPKVLVTDHQQWNMTLDAKFTGLRVWIKVVSGQDVWVSDYMCCNNPFHFTLEVSSVCEKGLGFQPLHLRVAKIDQIDFVQTVQYSDSHSSATLDVDYGRFDAVQAALSKYISAQSGRFMIKNSDGSSSDLLERASSVLRDVVFLNTGGHCIQQL